MPKPIVSIQDGTLGQINDETQNIKNGFKEVHNVNLKSDPGYFMAGFTLSELLEGDIDLGINFMLAVNDFITTDASKGEPGNRLWYKTHKITGNEELNGSAKRVVKGFSLGNSTRTKIQTAKHDGDLQSPYFGEIAYYRSRIWYSASFSKISCVYVYGSQRGSLTVTNGSNTASFQIGNREGQSPRIEEFASMNYKLLVEDSSNPFGFSGATVTGISIVGSTCTLTFDAPYTGTSGSLKKFYLYKTDANTFTLFNYKGMSTQLYRPMCVFNSSLYIGDGSFVYQIVDTINLVTGQYDGLQMYGEYKIVGGAIVPQYPLNIGTGLTIKQLLSWGDQLILLADKDLEDDYAKPYNGLTNESYIALWNGQIDNAEGTAAAVSSITSAHTHVWGLRVFNNTIFGAGTGKDEFGGDNDIIIFETNGVSLEVTKKLKIKNIRQETVDTGTTICGVHCLQFKQGRTILGVGGTVDGRGIYEITKFDEDQWALSKLAGGIDVTGVFLIDEMGQEQLVIASKDGIRYLTSFYEDGTYIDTVDYDLGWIETVEGYVKTTKDRQLKGMSIDLKEKMPENTSVETYYKIDEDESYTYHETFTADTQDIILYGINRRARKVSVRLRFRTNGEFSPKVRKINLF